jgi:hypothetical protein
VWGFARQSKPRAWGVIAHHPSIALVAPIPSLRAKRGNPGNLGVAIQSPRSRGIAVHRYAATVVLVTAKGHDGWIAIKLLHSGFSRTVRTESGMSAHRDGSIPQLHDIEINKMMDISSSDIYQKTLSGKVLPQLIIDSCHAEEELTPHLSYTLSNVLVSR